MCSCPMCQNDKNLVFTVINNIISTCSCSCGKLGGYVFWVDDFDIYPRDEIKCVDGKPVFPTDKYPVETLTYDEMLIKYPELTKELEEDILPSVSISLEESVSQGF